MVETSTSGSGEGPGEVTTRGYSTSRFSRIQRPSMRRYVNLGRPHPDEQTAQA
jgi:hypothetical protein